MLPKACGIEQLPACFFEQLIKYDASFGFFSRHPLPLVCKELILHEAVSEGGQAKVSKGS